MLASHFARDKLLEQAALEGNTPKDQRSSLQGKTSTAGDIGSLKPETAAPLEKTFVDSHVPELTHVDKSRDDADPLQILKVRFAKGEITKEEYEEMRKLLE